jgi:2-methylisocitrate lyase-like PEP mutase family enzyme
MDTMAKLSQAIAEGDGISILVEVADAESASRAEAQGAEGLVVAGESSEVRAASDLPLLHRGGIAEARRARADAVVVPPDRTAWDEGHALGLECVVRVSAADVLEEVLEEIDPEILLLAVEEGSEEDPLEVLLALLHDVPAGKLAIAELRDASAEDVAELERAGVDAVVVAGGEISALVGDGHPDV